ncbi:MAG: c-type cytochrome [Planctomycetes bacterium]|nr:c-type cytochrome [Planctomycetota bacterium]
MADQKEVKKEGIKREKRTPENQSEYFYSQRKLHLILLFSSLALMGSCGLMVYYDHARSWKEFQRAYQSIEKKRAEFELTEVESLLKTQNEVINKLEKDIKLEKRSLKQSELTVNFLWILFNVKKLLESRQLPVSRLVEVTDQDQLSDFISSQPEQIQESCQKFLELDLVGETKTIVEFTLNRIEQGEYIDDAKIEAKELLERFIKVVDSLAGKIKYEKIIEELNHLEGVFQISRQRAEFSQADYTFFRWQFEEAKHKFELSHEDSSINRQQAEQEFSSSKKDFERILLLKESRYITREPIENFRRSVKFALKIHERKLDALKSDLSGRLKEKNSIELKLKDLRDTLANKLRDAPMLDFFGSTVEVKQVILEDLYDELHFAKPQRIDRCQTCHFTIDNPQYETFIDGEGKRKFSNTQLQLAFEQAYTSQTERDRYIKVLSAHPKLDLYVKADSKHPMDKLGCTICHDGDGKETDFSFAVHIPLDEKKKKEWKSRFNYHYRELWDLPMLPAGFYEASCRRCHNQEMQLDGAEKYNLGMQVYEKAGCYACHKTDSYPTLPKHLETPHGKLDEIKLARRPGPTLTGIKSKVDKNWAYNWLLSPRSFRPVTRMPHFFLQPNSRDFTSDDGEVFESPLPDQLRAAALVEYLYSLSDKVQDAPLETIKSGDSTRGEKVVNTVGCYACHRFDENYEKDYFVNGTPLLDEFGPNLAGAAAKFGADQSKKWLFNWLKNPKHYYEEAVMPNLRLTDQEISDIIAYLTSDKVKVDNENRKVRQLAGWYPEEAALEVKEDKSVAFKKQSYEKLLNELLLTEFRRGMTFYDARMKINAFSSYDKVMTLGKELVKSYGCYSCHEMKDQSLPESKQWTNLDGIGAELTGAKPFASKHLDRIDFGKTLYDGTNHLGTVFKHPITQDEIYKNHNPVNINQLDNFKQGEEYDIKVPHTRLDWLRNKVLNPRLYDAGLLSSKPADELLRMPNLNLTKKEAELVTNFVLSFTDHHEAGLTGSMAKSLSTDESMYQQGVKLFRDFNCKGCHIVDPDRLLVTQYIDRGSKLAESHKWFNSIVEDKILLNKDELNFYIYKYLAGYSLSPVLNEVTDESELSARLNEALDNIQTSAVVEALDKMISRQRQSEQYYGTELLTEEVKGLNKESLLQLVDESLAFLRDDVSSCLSLLASETESDREDARKRFAGLKAFILREGMLYIISDELGQKYYSPVLLEPAFKVSWIVDNKKLQLHAFQQICDVVYLSQIERHIPKLGGEVISHLLSYKTKNNEVISGQETQIIPPYLFTQGKKTNPDWLFSFLKSPFLLRYSLSSKYDESKNPTLVNIRMPTFGFTDKEAQAIVDFFSVKDIVQGDPLYELKDVQMETKQQFISENLARIIYLYEVFTISCKSCHKINTEGSDIAPDLIHSSSRLKENWIFNFLQEPSKIYPKTPMPVPDPITPLTGDFKTARVYTSKVIKLIPEIEQVKRELEAIYEEMKFIKLLIDSEDDSDQLKPHLTKMKLLVEKNKSILMLEKLEDDLKEIFAREANKQNPDERIKNLAKLVPMYDTIKNVSKNSILKLLKSDELQKFEETKQIQNILSKN